ncbi:DUF7931 domain-containing protein [Ferribacterium limneticum]|uniref:DUF7931 domain-containing protein n=1 Tax=Ferribacterium limneticum TaxID=76259 RepID=UPI001CFADAEF|nr:hypothetical protein [Ferribacterium limneticum]UCV27586.1 hypothetical protein KI617_15100 [Ferribacterium limneticum]UCV31503.1 hypothetical protein KI608_15100 [Ferribacterium limneticum]
MARELITSWADYQTALDRLLAFASQEIRIYDEDLSSLKLESEPRQTHIKRILQAGHEDTLQIALRNASPFRQQHPVLLKLLSAYGHLAAVQETPPQLAHLRDSMILVDDKHALIRFERDLPRSKLLIDEIDEIRPYLTRFREIWTEGGESVSATTLGL